MSDYKITRMEMISGQGEAVGRRYHKVEDSNGRTWLYTNGPNAGGEIYVSNPNNVKGEGFGGAKLSMPLVDGGEFILNGGWHSNSDALYNATGVDLRNKHVTFVVIARGRKLDGWDTILTDVLHQDAEPLEGEFTRGRSLAQQMANDLGETLYYYSQNSGGSICGPVEPQ